MVTELLPSPGHQYELKKTVSATPTAEGYELWVCAACGAEKTEILSVCPHEFDTVRTPPTCTEPGRDTSTCRLCGYVKIEELPATGHNYEPQMSVEPTCTEEGFFRGKCTVCGDVISEKLPPAGHHFAMTEDGRRVCTICGAEDPEYAPRSLGRTVKSPVFIAISVVIVIQFATAAVLLVRHSRAMKRLRAKYRY